MKNVGLPSAFARLHRHRPKKELRHFKVHIRIAAEESPRKLKNSPKRAEQASAVDLPRM